ncbi:DUF5695 domain-containing protein [Sphingomonas morindae]|uniref:DUF5695 domain-containing protein n=1 Tax=Sphingomonas morindae TaxID=1541170 RepID=A0ABY4X5Q3_9SPHN|nr:DUF5695 domain-containing protein [Sphingomonas morindae]USI72232.1 DUF5695 domain-containing protein [Sphingomonas morindae]
MAGKRGQSRRLFLGGSAMVGLMPRLPSGAAAAPAALPGHVAGPFRLRLGATSQLLTGLEAEARPGFDFAAKGPADPQPGFYALGDIDLRWRQPGAPWQDASTAFDRRPVRPLPLRPGDLAAADLAPSLPDALPLRVERRWRVEGEALVLRVTIVNRAATAIELGGLGFALPFDNRLTGRDLNQAHHEASFTEAYMGLDAGHVQVAPLGGGGPVLLVLPEAGTPLENWAPIAAGPPEAPRLLEDRRPRSLTFEGFYRWLVASAGFAEQEWRGVEQWNPPSQIRLEPGARRRFGLRFVLAPGVRAIETRLRGEGRPLAVGLPGYVLPADCPADLFLAAPAAVAAMEISPADALTLTPLAAPAAPGWLRYRVTGHGFGRARLLLRYADGRRHAIHYFRTKAATDTVSDLGRFLFTRQWYDRADDGFGRSPSIMSYDRERDAIVTQDKRVWIAGLSDEGGAGSWLAAIMKQLIAPDPQQIAQFERFHVETIETRLQVPDGPLRDGVRKSLFFYDPAQADRYDPAIDWTSWSSWKRDAAQSVVRSFNYVHVTAAQWVLYRLARTHVGLVKAHDWRWYLARAARTALAMPRLAPEYAGFGQMEGDVFVALLADLRREQWHAEGDALEAAMRARAEHWRAEAYPFGSEMPWDSTGQEEVYAWMQHFGFADKAALTREVILAYDPLIPHWGYNGSARRYWDFLFAGKTARLERQLHHYGSTLNALPLFDSFRRAPEDVHLLRVAYGGLMGGLTNIDEQGFGACAFHAYPDMLRFDGYSGDYGMSFFGHAFATATYVIRHETFGWLAFGGTLEMRGGTIHVAPRDSARTRLFLAPQRLWLELEAGRFTRFDHDPASGAVRIGLAPATPHAPVARLRIETAPGGSGYRTERAYARDRGAMLIPLNSDETEAALILG